MTSELLSVGINYGGSLHRTKQPMGVVVPSNCLPELCGIDEPHIVYVSMLYDKVLAGMLNEVRVGIITIHPYILR